MNFLDALFSGAKALAKELVSFGSSLVREILREIDNSPFGRAATRVVARTADRMFGDAQDLADEERELASKYQRDGWRSDADAERLRELEAERGQLRIAMYAANAARNAQEFKEKAKADGVHVHELDDDELGANVGILAEKKCPQCGAMMHIVHDCLSTTLGRVTRKFYWRCTAIKLNPCPKIYLHPERERASVIRPESADFDTPKAVRREIWDRQPVINETHSRVRQHLGDDDKELVCPIHLLPLKLMQSPRPSGKICGSYEYVCLSVNADGSFCSHKVTLDSMPQVASMLQRTEGEGIIRG